MTNPIQANPIHEESTYQLLVRSEEKERGAVEAIVYLLLLIANVTTIWQFSHQPVTFTDLGARAPAPVVAML